MRATASAAAFERLAPEAATLAGDVDRTAARAWLDAHGWPGRRHEAWRYTPLDAVAAAGFAARPETEAPTTDDLDLTLPLARASALPCALRLVYVNGRFASAWSAEGAVPGLRGDAWATPGRLDPDDDRIDGFGALVHLAGGEGAVVEIDDETVVDGLVHVAHLSVPSPAPTASHVHTRFRVGAGSRVSLVESFTSLPGAHLTNSRSVLAVGPGADVDLLRVVDGSEGGVHLGHTSVDQDEGSTVRAGTATLGPGVARHATAVRLGGDGTSTTLSGLALPTGGGHHDLTAAVDHRSSHGRSDQRYRAVVADGARASFGGHVRVGAGTRATRADQSSRNLLLGPTAQADARPWLEIFSDDVACTHGATVGRLDDDAVFYLRARGIPVAEARRMLVAAFAGASIDEVAPEPVRPWLRAGAEAVLGTAGTVGVPAP